jgi:prepilin-type processing-associated H-X9-DG protein
MKTTCSPGVPRNRADGFTLTDLLAIVFTIGVLGALLVPALAGTKPNSQAFQCLENQRQLVRAWQMYAQDYQGNLARNGNESAQPTSVTDTTSQYASQWCPGRQDNGVASQAVDPAWIRLGCIYPYVKSVTLYRCPADVSTAFVFGQMLPRTRSISMNGWVGPYDAYTTSGRTFYKESDLGIMGPASLFLLMDESPYSINDGFMTGYPPPVSPGAPNLIWVDYPATYHNGGAGISFCDGHAQIKKWTDPVVLNMKSPTPVNMPATPGNADLPWLQALSTRGK